jgi:peptide-methionine (R)-S-oxide reductase
MLSRRTLLSAGAAIGIVAMFFRSRQPSADPRPGPFEITKTDEEWRRALTPEQYYILRGHGTERPFTSPLDREKRTGTFACAGCALPLFSSATKFDSGTGWPSFYIPLENAVGTQVDR